MRVRAFFAWLGAGGLLATVLYEWRKPAAPPATTNPLYTTMLNGVLRGTVPFVSVAQLTQPGPVPALLDTRTAAEFAVSHLRGATWVGYDDFSLARLPSLAPDAPIVVYCSVGVRSERIGRRLHEAGFSNVRNLYGGIFEWVNEGQPVVVGQGQGQPTARVHAYSPAWGIWLRRGQRVY